MINGLSQNLPIHFLICCILSSVYFSEKKLSLSHSNQSRNFYKIEGVYWELTLSKCWFWSSDSQVSHFYLNLNRRKTSPFSLKIFSYTFSKQFSLWNCSRKMFFWSFSNLWIFQSTLLFLHSTISISEWFSLSNPLLSLFYQKISPA